MNNKKVNHAYMFVNQLFKVVYLFLSKQKPAEKVGFLWELNGAKERLKVVKPDLMMEGKL